MKLKTLKDLKRDVPLTTPTSSSLLQGVLLETELKAEAVKWVKEFEPDHEKGDITCLTWIKHFFNLTEEEIKDGNI